MIYASLVAIRAWNNPLVAPGYVVFGLATGALWLGGLARLWGAAPGILDYVAAGAVLIAWLLKLAYWLMLDSGASASTPGTATGLGGGTATVRLLDAPNTQENFVMAEMGYRIARKHAVKLRRTAQMLAFALPLGLLAAASALPAGLGTIAALAAATLGTAGLLVERWLFFAEARHAVTLYYGADAV
jgi:DMSO reductase anchor subunit